MKTMTRTEDRIVGLMRTFRTAINCRTMDLPCQSPISRYISGVDLKFGNAKPQCWCLKISLSKPSARSKRSCQCRDTNHAHDNKLSNFNPANMLPGYSSSLNSVNNLYMAKYFLAYSNKCTIYFFARTAHLMAQWRVLELALQSKMNQMSFWSLSMIMYNRPACPLIFHYSGFCTRQGYDFLTTQRMG